MGGQSSYTCVACGHANRETARFCEDCGAALAQSCGACGSELRPGARFCDACGAQMPAGAVPSAEAALKVVSVVFCDLAGSTALQETLDAESVRRVMARFYEVMRGVVERFDGSVAKFIGDAIVASFGAPVSHEDDALRAVRCAAAMVAELDVLNDELEPSWGVRLAMRTGVNTGELVVDDQGILVGDTMNTAARLEQAARPGDVLVGEPTRRLVRGHVALEELEPLELKGKSAPVRAWRVLDPYAESGEAGGAGAEAPLVGREYELLRLRAALDGAIASRNCRLVSVIGGPGLGKSRLAAEFGRSVGDGVVVVEGHCEPSGEGITFLPIAEVLRAAASIDEADSREEVVAKLTELVGDDADRDRVASRAAALLGAGDPAPAEETFWGVRRVLEGLARRQPLVVVFDDVHWGQPMFLDLLEHLVEWIRDAPVLLVALARPELREIREVLAAAGRRPVDVIELEPLDPGESEELVSGLLGAVDLPGALLARILETTEGNPLFLGELLRMLVDEGSLVQEQDVWVAAGGAEAVHVPPTIQALLTARIERLRADERSVVERAAVIGKQFYRGAVAELVAPPVRSGLDGHLETLRRKDMVEPEGTYWIDEPVYRFHHVLIRDAAYHLLLKEARAELHEKFADWLALKAGDLVGEHEEVIAYHLEQAHAYRELLGPLDEHGRALGARAAMLLASAGRRALAREDLAAASNLLHRSLERGVEDDAETLWDLAETLLSAGDTARVTEVVDRLAPAAPERAAVLSGQLAVVTGAGSLELTLASVTAATAALAEAGDGEGEAKGHHVTAQVQVRLGQVAAVEAALDRALLAARKAEDRRRITAVLAAAPRAALWGPSPVVRASGRCLDVVRILRMTPGNRHVEAVALRCQAVLEAMRGRPEAARDILEAGRITLEELGLTVELHELALHAGIVELLSSEPADAAKLLRSARDGFESFGMATSAGQASALLARALVEQGHDDEAIAETEVAESHAGGDLKTTITWCGVRAEALARGGAIDEAMELARRAVQLAEPTDALADKADANMALARVLSAACRHDEAREAAVTAKELYAAKDHAVGVGHASDLDLGAEPTSTAPAPQPVATGPGIDDPELEAFFERYGELWEAGDADGVLALYDPEVILLDHRQLGWDLREGWAAQLQMARSVLDATSDRRFSIVDVIASAPGLIALRFTWRGHSAETGGAYEMTLGMVSVIRQGRLVRAELFDPDAEFSMRACFADLRGRGLLGDREPERWFARLAEQYGSHDPVGMGALWAQTAEYVDHRGLAWEPLVGREAIVELSETSWAIATDARCAVDEVLACDERVIAVRCRFSGAAADGGGRFEYPVGYVSVIEGGVCVRCDQFEIDDREGMLARYGELGGRPPEAVFGDRPPERVLAETVRLWSLRDVDKIVELYAEDFVIVDHRQLGWEEVRGVEAGRAVVESGLGVSPDLRLEVHEVLACDNRVIAARVVWRGTSADGGGEFDNGFGYVIVVDGGLIHALHQFEPDDRVGMVACYVELGGGLVVLGERAPERWMREYLARFAARDADGLRIRLDEQVIIDDHRDLGWDGVPGVERALELFESAWRLASDVRQEAGRVLACDGRVIALTGTWEGTAAEDAGGGRFTIPFGAVVLIAAGRLLSCDIYDHDDTDAILARFSKLGGVETELAQRPPERWAAEFTRLWRAGEWERLLDLYAEDSQMLDHRSLPLWEPVNGREGWRAWFAGIDAMKTERRDFVVDEQIACDDRVLAARVRWMVTVDGADGEIAGGLVGLFQNGVAVSLDVYDPDDREAVCARFAELAPEQRPPERWMADYSRAYNAHDLDGALGYIADDFVHVDRRRLRLWGENRGRDNWREQIRGALAPTSDSQMVVSEMLACDDRVAAAVWSFPGTYRGGPYANTMGMVVTVQDGLLERIESYEPDDRQAMIARYAELGGGFGPLGDRPPERWMREFFVRYAARNTEAMVALVDERVTLDDHRNLGWDPIRGVEQLAALWQSGWAASSDLRLEVDGVLACDDRVIALRGSWAFTALADSGGGKAAIPFGLVALIDGGRAGSWDLYEFDDTEAILARYKELSAATARLGDTPVERAAASYLDRVKERDVEGIAGLLAADVTVGDHRPLGGPPGQGRDAAMALLESALAITGELRFELEEVLERSESVLACRGAWLGTSSAGEGEVAIPMAIIASATQGLLRSLDLYDHDDLDPALERFLELLPAYERFDYLYNTRRLEELLELYTDDYVMIDRRSMAWEEIRGGGALVETCRSFLENAPDLRSVCRPLVPDDGKFVLLRNTFTGQGYSAGGVPTGPVELVFIEVGEIRENRFVFTELFDPADEALARARYEELRAGPSATA